MQVQWLDVALFGGVSLLSATVAVLLTGYLTRIVSPRRAAAQPVLADAMRRYEFREGYLISAIDPNDAFLPADTDRSAAFQDLARALATLNPELPARFDALVRRGEPFVVTGRFGDDALSVAGRAEEGRTLISIGPTEAGTGREIVDVPALQALRSEVEEMRRALDFGRAAIWTEDDEGRVLWANGPYITLAERLLAARSGDVTWPLPALFADQLDPMPESGSLRRCHLPLPEGDQIDRSASVDGSLWFEVSARRQGDAVMCCAIPIDRLVAAETALRNFVQTLSKTFAHLPIGLAIFDKKRELMLFNPALVTLSTLPPDFLSRRPRLVAFLDALRDRQRMPEPKNYRTWRDEIAHLEERAEQGTYQELWTLPGGQSFRVIGRPHPDGAVAFMFEDITSEVLLTRQFRGELDLYQSVFDETPDALAVFSGEGRLVMANRAYAALWSVEPGDHVGVLSLADATRHWQSACQPCGCWSDIRQFAERKTDRTCWSDEVALKDGRRLTLQVGPLAGGATSVRFVASEPEVAPGPARFTRAARTMTASDLTEVAEEQAPYLAR